MNHKCNLVYLFTIILIVLNSCYGNENDKLLKEAYNFISKDITEIIKNIKSDDNSIHSRTMAEYTRFFFVFNELENHQNNMSIDQLEKYLNIYKISMEIIDEIEINIRLYNSNMPNIDFSEFKNLIMMGEIKRVGIGEKYLYGYETSFNRNNSKERIYRTIPVNDPDFIRLLDEKNVSYYGILEDSRK